MAGSPTRRDPEKRIKYWALPVCTFLIIGGCSQVQSLDQSGEYNDGTGGSSIIIKKSSESEVDALLKRLGNGTIPLLKDKFKEILPDFDAFTGNPRKLPQEDRALAVLLMFHELGFMRKLRLEKDWPVLAKFVLTVQKNYRTEENAVPYHNWGHGFSAGHSSYLLIRNLKMVSSGYLTELETLSLFVAVLCHDLDHPGTGNSFQEFSNSTIFRENPSAGSYLERHHLGVTRQILSTPGCDIFKNLKPGDRETVDEAIKDVILASDLKNHILSEAKIAAMVDGKYKKDNPDHHRLLLGLLMSACDFTDQTKDWENSLKMSILVNLEFFQQGDAEKVLGKKDTAKQNDRTRADITGDQIGFLERFVIPVFRNLNDLFPETMDKSLHTVKRNYELWRTYDKLYKEYVLEFGQPADAIEAINKPISCRIQKQMRNENPRLFD